MDTKILYRLTRSLNHLFIDKNSKFIVLAAPVSSFKDATKILEETRKKYYDASHNCWAYSNINYERSSDDGEPTNSAGKPILQAITTSNITDVIVIVTRYFGGTELGVGGLQRAYKDATKQCLSQVSIGNGCEIIIPTSQVLITTNMNDIGTVYQILNLEQSCVRVHEKFLEATVEFLVEIPSSRVSSLSDILINRCKGRAVVALVESQL